MEFLGIEIGVLKHYMKKQKIHYKAENKIPRTACGLPFNVNHRALFGDIWTEQRCLVTPGWKKKDRKQVTCKNCRKSRDFRFPSLRG